MAQQTSYGGGVLLHSYSLLIPQATGFMSFFPQMTGGGTMDLTGEKVAIVGRVTLAGRSGSKTISSAGGKIHALLGTTTFADAGTSLDVGIHDVTNLDPDGTFDTKGTFVGGTDTLTQNVINSFAMETGSKTIAHNDLVAIVFDMTARAGADSVIVRGGPTSSGTGDAIPYCRFHNATSWVTLQMRPNILIEFDDGTFGWFQPDGFRPSAAGSQAFNSGTGTADEYGARIKLPWKVDLEGITLPLDIAGNSSDFELCIYSDIAGTPTHVSGSPITFDASNLGDTGTIDDWVTVMFPSLIQLAAGTVYGWTVRPTTANSVTLNWADFGAGNNAKMAALAMGPESYQIKRLDNAGAFTLTDTLHIPHILHIAKFSDDAGGGASGGVRLAGHGGFAA